LPDTAGFPTIDQGVADARDLASKRDWRCEIHDQQPGQIAFEVHDNKTFFGQEFRINTDRDGMVRSTRLPSGCRSALVALLLVLVLTAVFVVASFSPRINGRTTTSLVGVGLEAASQLPPCGSRL